MSNAISATCGSHVSLLIGQKSEKQDARLSGVSAHLESKTCVFLLPTRERIQTKMQNMRQGVCESLSLYIARIQNIESESCIISSDPEAVRNPVTMKLVTSISDE